LSRDRLGYTQGALFSQRVTALLEPLSGLRTDSGFEIQPIGNPLMMDARRFHCRANRHVKIEHVQNRLQSRANNPRTACGSNHQLGTTRTEHDGGRHAAERPFLRLKRISLIADEPINISDCPVNGKIIHFIVEHDSRSRREQFGTETCVDRLGA